MSRFRELRHDQLDLLPAPCRGCLFWPAGLDRGRDDPEALEAWWTAVELEWGAPGHAVVVDEVLQGFVLHAPPTHVQRARRQGPPPGDDALLVLTLWVDPRHRGAGIARQLVQMTARAALSRDLRAVELYAQVGLPPDPAEPGACLLSDRVPEGLGFVEVARVGGVALYRMDLSRTVRWAEQLGRALGDVASVLSAPGRRVPKLGGGPVPG